MALVVESAFGICNWLHIYIPVHEAKRREDPTDNTESFPLLCNACCLNALTEDSFSSTYMRKRAKKSIQMGSHYFEFVVSKKQTFSFCKCLESFLKFIKLHQFSRCSSFPHWCIKTHSFASKSAAVWRRLYENNTSLAYWSLRWKTASAPVPGNPSPEANLSSPLYTSSIHKSMTSS